MKDMSGDPGNLLRKLLEAALEFLRDLGAWICRWKNEENPNVGPGHRQVQRSQLIRISVVSHGCLGIQAKIIEILDIS